MRDMEHNKKCRETEKNIYEKRIKRMLDKSLSFAGLLALSPVYAAAAIAVFADDPGPVFFTQKRIGKNKKLFMLHKFRTMKMCTPHDVPTHQLKNPEQYITRVGKFLRKYSLDELPQVWDIFVGNMSIIGPRPALWNQDDLVAERDKYGANDVKPGLTGWAQINGRDELEIPEKARLDGEYVKHLKQGGLRAFFFDAKCLAGTVGSVLGHDGVVEGGTGEMHKERGRRAEKCSLSGAAAERGLIRTGQTHGTKTKGCKTSRMHRKDYERDFAGCRAAGADERNREDAGFEDYGHLKHFDIDTGENNRKHVLITGADSYIGKSFEKWAGKHYPANFEIDTLDMRDKDWRKKDFSAYDTVFHVAGIAHADVGKVLEREKKKYYAVNTDLAIETAQKAKAEGVKQFVFMSSMIIYGDSAPYGKEKVIDEHTAPAPANFYGNSKWQADKGVRKLADENFTVTVLRPPMIYGKGSKGNYAALAKMAKKLLFFPNVQNERSMLYIENLCEFLCQIMLRSEGGIFWPQNAEYASTSEMACLIAQASNHRILVSRIWNWTVSIVAAMPGKTGGLANKAFGNMVYDQGMSKYDFIYQVVGFKESITRMFEE